MSGAIRNASDPLNLFSKPKTDKPAEPAPIQAPAIEARTADFETRAQSVGQRASAAGAARSDNEADLLGYSLPKKRSAGRVLLG